MALVLNLQESTTTPPTPQTNQQPTTTTNSQQPTSNNQQPKNNNQNHQPTTTTKTKTRTKTNIINNNNNNNKPQSSTQHIHWNLLCVGPLVWDYFNMNPCDDHAWVFAERLEIKRVQGNCSMHNFNHTRWAPTIVINGVITPLKLPYKWGTVFFFTPVKWIPLCRDPSNFPSQAVQPLMLFFFFLI